MEINRSPPPPSYWTQPSNSSRMPHHRRSSPPILTPPVLIILLPIITFLFLLFAIPPFLSFTSHIFRPIAVKRSWDLLNIFLVLFAVLCGIFARRNDDESENNDVNSNVVPNLNRTGEVEESEPVNPQRWFGFSDDRRSEKIYDGVNRTAESSGLRRLRRSSSSYPDLRQESLWETRDDQRFQFRFFDDFEMKKYRETAPFDPSREARERWREAGDGEAKEIPVGSFVVRPSTPPKSPSPSKSPSPATTPPPPSPPPVDRHKPRRAYRAVDEWKEKPEKKHEYRNDIDNDQFTKARSPPPTPPPPPPLPPASPARIKYVNLEPRKSNVKKEIAMALTALYSQRKRKKKQKIASTSSSGRDSATSSPTEQTKFPPPSPPPPPPPLPPPPSSVFHNLFTKGSKNKRIHTVHPPAPPPPPPPPQSSKQKNRSTPPPAPPTRTPVSSSLRPCKHKNRSASLPPPAPPTPPPPPETEHSRSGGRPPLLVRSVNHYEENVNSGSQSPLIPMPPQPPPPPPFKMSEFKFVVRGHYVRIRSTQSSRCSSPELDDVDASSTKLEPHMVNVGDGGDGPVAGSVSCPSPDVNIKADTFIARLYDGWRLEKMNSLREKRKI